MLEKGNAYYEDLELFCETLKSNTDRCFPDVSSKTLKQLKNSILKASNQYVFDENTSLWSEKWFQEAYLAYFILTQGSRLFYTFNRIKSMFFPSDFEQIVDFGCGPGTALITAHAVFKESLDSSKWVNIDSAEEALGFSKKLSSAYKLRPQHLKANKIPPPKTDNSLLILSFALCEGFDLSEAFNYHSILILEPGQFKNSKELIRLRSKFIDSDFHALAPCTHQLTCPMTEGKKNWCHDTAPKPKSIPSFDLPFSNDRLNLSYLLVSRTPSNADLTGAARVIGDLRPEKGKSKVSICQSEEPVFLSWLKKSKLNPCLSRGDLINIPEKVVIKGQEVRIEEDIQHKH